VIGGEFVCVCVFGCVDVFAQLGVDGSGAGAGVVVRVCVCDSDSVCVCACAFGITRACASAHVLTERKNSLELSKQARSNSAMTFFLVSHLMLRAQLSSYKEKHTTTS